MAFTPVDLASADEAIASGSLEVKFQDRSITYRSIDELLKARGVIYNALYPNASAGGMRRQVRMVTDRGF